MAKPPVNRIVVFTRFPVAGKAKTRLIPTIGAAAAADLQRDMSGRTLLAARVAAWRCAADIRVIFNDGTRSDMERWLGRNTSYARPTGTDLGESMHAGFTTAHREGRERTLTIGSDCPGLTPELIQTAFEALDRHEAVLGPATDGGYYLIGLRTPQPELFRDKQWGQSSVLQDSLNTIERLGLRWHLLPRLSDVDVAEDLAHWHTVSARPLQPGQPKVSVIIPTLNEAARIAETVRRIAATSVEVLVVDGGSHDATVSQARAAGARVLTGTGTRSQLLNAGAWEAQGDVLVFLHADTRLPDDYARMAHDALLRPGVAAGAFSFAIDAPSLKYRMVELFTNLRSRLLSRPYGDQALFMPRTRFHRMGGFAELPVMDDFELVTRLQRQGRVVTLPALARTSARRWQKLGLSRTLWINQRMLWAYHRGMPPEDLKQLYERESGVD